MSCVTEVTQPRPSAPREDPERRLGEHRVAVVREQSYDVAAGREGLAVTADARRTGDRRIGVGERQVVVVEVGIARLPDADPVAPVAGRVTPGHADRPAGTD